jgi:asparagine synthase (glutamine-hydrolysing)
MCGITGFCDFNKKTNQQTLQNMTDVLHHRGPDDSGYSFYNVKNCNIGLGHRRLSILDLSTHGHQPMLYNNLEMVYNGEVYNFKEVRKELEKYNYTFDSDSDTEVILKAYDKWGIKAVDKLNGMFAIAIYDKTSNKFIMIRDRVGVKPFYYYYKNNLFMFSSELKSFHENKQFEKSINIDALALYMQYGYIPEPYTIFNHTHKLKAGYYLELDTKTQKIEEKKYWDVVDFYNKPKLNISEEEAINETEKILKSAFEYRMVSDVPVGVFLSGGYDSSIVTAILQNQRKEKINTFTIGFQEKGFDEAPYAKEIANYLGTNHTEYYCTAKDAIEIIPKLCEIYDEPFGDDSAIPTILVSRLAKQDVSVSLSADGGDEIFAGYNNYLTAINYYKQFEKLPKNVKNIISKGMDYIDPNIIPIMKNQYNIETRFDKIQNLLMAESSIEALGYISQTFTNQKIKRLFKQNTCKLQTAFDLNISHSNDDINKMLAIDYKMYMKDCILTKVDRATMSVSLEGREPLLDYRLIEYVSQLPSNLKYKNGDTKWLLKQVAHKYIPKKMLDRPKKGFSVPIHEWFKDELKEYFTIYLDEKRIEKEGIFNIREVQRLKDKYLNGNTENVQQLWLILIFEMWYERWM